MSTPTPHQGEPFADAAREAAENAAMAVRLVMAIADAVRRARETNAGKEQELPGRDVAMAEAAGELKSRLPPDIATALMTGADWPQMAQQLVALRRAGVDLEEFLPRVAGIAVQVRNAVEQNMQRIASEGNDEWAKLLRETMPAGPVREAILASPAWPQMAGQMQQLDARGVDVGQMLTAAHEAGLGVDQAVARVLDSASAKASAPALSRDVRRSYGPLTEGLDVPGNVDLSDRRKALAQLGVSPNENFRYVREVRQALEGHDRAAELLESHPKWPYLAARMSRMEGAGQSVAQHLQRLKEGRWKEGPAGQLATRLLVATTEALRTPLEKSGGPPVSTAAARAASPGGPTSAAKSSASAEPAAAAHRAPAASSKQARRR